MPPRSSWKGFLKLSLVSVPVKAYTANATGAEIRLNQLHAECNSRVKYQKICPTHGELASGDIVSGYEFSKGQYVVIDLEEMSKLRTEADKAVRIDGFIDPAEIDPIYHSGRTYYLVPDGPVGQKPYALLRKGMEDAGKHAIAQVVISGKEQLVLVRPVDDMLAMTVLSFSDRVKSAEGFNDELVDSEIDDQEMSLAHTLIGASTLAEFDYKKYKDDYTAKMTKLIQAKVDGQEIVAAPEPEEPQIINLMEALKASVARAQADPVDEDEGDEAAPAKAVRKTTKKKMASSSQRATRGRKSG